MLLRSNIHSPLLPTVVAYKMRDTTVLNHQPKVGKTTFSQCKSDFTLGFKLCKLLHPKFATITKIKNGEQGLICTTSK